MPTNSYKDVLDKVDAIVAAHAFDPRAVGSAVRTVYLVTQLDFEVTVGGVLQWLMNDSGRYASDTAVALDEIGANNCAATVRQIMAFFPDEVVPDDDGKRLERIQSLLPTAERSWRQLGDSLLEWPDDVDALLRKYVELHDAEF